MENFAQDLSDWFVKVKRDFPWRIDRSPYKVLISEVMLQQTLASVVVSYFNRWMDKFPSFKELASADEADVIKAWEGLGYYSRARNLHTIAKVVMDKFGGDFPIETDQILSFKGIGPYTAAAISHFAFDRRVIGCDGNIKKVLARFYGYRGYISNDKDFIELLETFLPQEKSRDAFEGLIELGATVCGKKPSCDLCPLRGGCKAFSEELIELIPLRKKREKTIQLKRSVFVIEADGYVVIKRENKKLMNGLYEFPYLEQIYSDHNKMASELRKQTGLSVEVIHLMNETSHTFTKYKAVLTPLRCRLLSQKGLEGDFDLVALNRLQDLPFSSGHRKILKQLIS